MQNKSLMITHQAYLSFLLWKAISGLLHQIIKGIHSFLGSVFSRVYSEACCCLASGKENCHSKWSIHFCEDQIISFARLCMIRIIAGNMDLRNCARICQAVKSIPDGIKIVI